MDLVAKRSLLAPLPPPPPHSAATSFPIIAIAVIGILATAFLLVTYYIFVIKCCLNWHRIDLLRRFSLSRNRNNNNPLTGYSPSVENRGLDESIIRSIPIFHYKTDSGERNLSECAVCLNEFIEDEKLKRIPNCRHIFHIDCIDIWLQNNANCPLCRHSISSTTTSQFEPVFAPSSSPVDRIERESDEEYVVIELGSQGSTDGGNSKIEQKKRGRNLKKVNSMGDECINMRQKDEQFEIQPIRRSFSMDLSADRQLCLSIQEIVQQSRIREVISPNLVELGCSSSRLRRNYFFSLDRKSVV